jgi:hypothetical protein
MPKLTVAEYTDGHGGCYRCGFHCGEQNYAIFGFFWCYADSNRVSSSLIHWPLVSTSIFSG